MVEQLGGSLQRQLVPGRFARYTPQIAVGAPHRYLDQVWYARVSIPVDPFPGRECTVQALLNFLGVE